MRIISGKFKSRKLVTLSGPNTRPMTDRMKESVFNIIGPFFDGEAVLDLFGGSGALSLESISRGAKSALIVEKSSEAAKIIKTNIASLELNDEVKLLQMDYAQALKRIVNMNQTFDLVFLDPPYSLKVIDELITFLLENNLVKTSSYIICHYFKNNHTPINSPNLEIIRNYNNGSSELTIYKVKK